MSVSTHLQKLGSQLRVQSTEARKIKTSLTAVAERLSTHFTDEVIGIHPFGSSTRGTMLPRTADPDSDLDMLVIFRNADRVQPQALYNRLRTFAQKYYPRSLVTQSAPTVVLELNHIKFDLVPSIRRGVLVEQLHIPAPRTAFRTWLQTDPQSLTKAIDRSHRAHKGLIRPVVRIVKYWNARHGRVFDSYALEEQIASFWFTGAPETLRRYFYRTVGSLDDTALPHSKKQTLHRFQQRVDDIHKLDSVSNPTAEASLRELLPLLR